jgi:hypothetical protein
MPRTRSLPGSRRPARRCGELLRAVAGLVVIAGCASTEPAVEAGPLDAGQLALSAERASALDAPYRIVFDWSLNEPGMRLQGRGVARVEPPYRARLDLFTRSGERITSAAIVDGEVRVPEGLPSILPPATLLWGSLGVFRPGREMGLAGGTWRTDGTAELRYLPAEDAELLVRLSDSRIREMVHRSRNRTVEELRLVRGEGERFPREATYRDLTSTRELRMTLESVEHVESYPTDIWNPGR